MKRPLPFLLLLSTCLPFATASSSEAKAYFDIVWMPTVYKCPAEVKFTYHDPLMRDFRMRFTLSAAGSNVPLVDQVTNSYSFDGRSYYDGNFYFDTSLCKIGTIYRYRVESFYGESAARNYTLYCEKTLSSKIQYTVYTDRTINTNRLITNVVYGMVQPGNRDSYVFKGSNQTRESGIRSFGLTDYRITLTTPFRENRFTQDGELRIKDHFDEFEDLGKRFGGGRTGYITIPVVLYPIETYQTTTTYGFKLKSTFYVNLNNLRMSKTPMEGELWRPTIKDIFLPTGYGHDDDSYKCDIVVYNFTEFDDTLIFKRTCTYPTQAHFGACKTSDYCVVVG